MYDWKRFWCPVDGSFSLADEGFLFDPESEYGNRVNPGVLPFEQLESIHCLVLWGEPGIGKSTSLRAEVSNTTLRHEQTDHEVVSIDLSEYGDESRLIRDVFETRAFTEWAKGSHVLHLFLDSLDECKLQIPHAAKILRRQFEKHRARLDRLRLRIACRTADWPSSLTETFCDLWGEESQRIYELVPLRRKDVVAAAVQEDIDASEFVTQLIRASAQPLAIKPITLSFLLRTYNKHGSFPSSQEQLYFDGCHLLCDDPNRDRREANQIGDLSREQRFAIAGRIAAALIFCNRSAIFKGPNDDAKTPGDLLISDLQGGVETVAGTSFDAERGGIEETLGTGLFSGRGSDRIGFAHQTYAEFMAARYLVDHKLELSQQMSLICHADDVDCRVVPQLGETAAWLAGMNEDVFQAIMKSDPQILVRSDVAKTDEADRALIVERLLALFDAGELTETNRDERTHYHKLKHRGIAQQLKPFIRDRSKGNLVRRFALNLAEECEVVELQSLLADLALDADEAYNIRYRAAFAVMAIGDDATRLRLKPLAFADFDEDSDFTLKAAVLRGLWPSRMSAAELFSAIKPPRDDTAGNYGYFLSHQLCEDLTVADLPHALRWAATLDDAESDDYYARELVCEIVLRAWENLHNAEVRQATADFVLSRLSGYGDIIPASNSRFKDHEARRRELVRLVLPRIDDFEQQGYSLVFNSPGLLRSSDLQWMIEQLNAEKETRQIRFWAKLIGRVFDGTMCDQLEAVVVASENNDALREEFDWLLTPVELDSELAEKMRTRHEERARRDREMEERRNPPPLDPPPATRIAQHLTECEAGNAIAWYFACRDLQLEENSTTYPCEFQYDLTTLPGWLKADSVTRTRIIEGAVRYLKERTAEPEEWLGTNSIRLTAIAGYKALLLLRKTASHHFESLSPDVWENWAPAVVSFHDLSRRRRNSRLHDEIACACFSNAPDAVVASLVTIIRERLNSNDIAIIPEFVERCWSERIRSTLLQEAKDPSLRPTVTDCLLQTLLEHSCDESKRYAVSLLSLPVPESGPERDRAVMAAKSLIQHAGDAGWDAVWPAIQSDSTFGRTVVEVIAYRDMHDATLATKLSEADVANFYIWLVRQYPHADDPPYGRAGLIGSRESITHYRDAVLRVLQHRGTRDAIAAINKIMEQLPELDWMSWYLVEAKRVALRQTWRPLSPRDLLALTQRSDSRLVQSGAQLQGVILESLAQLQTELQAETPAAPDLWDEIADGIFRPKDENHLSDYVKRYLERHLKTRGIVALREVEIRRGEGAAKGERTDIHVTGMVPGVVDGTLDQVRVIIELKGTWHDEVEVAMATQLANRYLKENECRHGIYVVGWYHCDQWDKGHSGYKKSRKEPVDEARSRFESQASRVSSNSRTIKAFVLNASLR